MNTDTRELVLCDGPQLVDDVQINIDNFLVAGATATGTAQILLSLHAPPVANQVQFVLEYDAPLSVIDHGDGSWTAGCTSECATRLYDLVRHPKNGKISEVFIGRFDLPFSITARGCGDGEDPCSAASW